MAQVQDFQGRRVAVIDSDDTNRLIARETLTGWGLQADEFSNPNDALQAIVRATHDGCGYAAALVDRRMPTLAGSNDGLETDGFHLLSKIRAKVPGLPVIMLASEELPGDDRRPVPRVSPAMQSGPSLERRCYNFSSRL